MALGYEGSVSFENNLILATSASIPQARNKLESSSAYGGKFNSPTDEIGIFSPVTYDFPTFDGSIGFDLSQNFLTELITWVFARQESRIFNIKPTNGSEHLFNTCYWNSISLSASEGSPVTGNISILAVDRDLSVYGDDYIDNKSGEISCQDLSLAGQVPSLNKSKQLAPIPFWNTSIFSVGGISSSGTLGLLSWNISYSQAVQRFYKAEANPDPQAPFVGIGPMSVTVDLEFFQTSGELTFLETLTEFNLNVGNSVLKFKKLQLQTDVDNVATGGQIIPISLTYDAYEIAL